MLRIFTWMKVLVFLLLLSVAGGYFLYSSEWFQKKFLYPFPYQQLIYHYARENDLDPYLVAAVIRTESKFVAQARSPKGAQGLMQLMPETAAWLATQMDVQGFEVSDLNNPETNIRFGTWYLVSLKQEFKGNEILALAAYNGGRGNVRQWMKQYGWSYAFNEVEQIPFRETREYVGKVRKSQERYRDLYGR